MYVALHGMPGQGAHVVVYDATMHDEADARVNAVLSSNISIVPRLVG